MSSRWSWLALGAGAYVAFTLSAFPASTAIRWFAPPEVSLIGVEGTVWSGRAAGGNVAGLPIQDVRWRVSPWSLLLARIAGNVEARVADGFVTTEISARPGRLQLSGLRGGTSLSSLMPVLPVRGMRGQATVTLTALDIVDAWPERIVGELRLMGLEVQPLVRTAAQQMLPLGDYTVTFLEAQPGQVSASFVDNGGPLAVTGTAVVEATRAYMLDAFVAPRSDAPEALVEGLKIMTTEPDAEGRRRLTLTGSL